MSDKIKLSEVEIAKEKSRYLRGTLQESLANDITGALNHDDTHLIKFHGSYQQTDRDIDGERKRQKLEPLFSFMIRVRLAGGIVAPAQWIRMSELADQYGDGGLKLTIRQAFQLHGVSKTSLKNTIAGFNDVLLDSIAGCGDVNRNVMCNPNSYASPAHEAVVETAKAISLHLTPKTSAYWELWLDGQQVDEQGEPKANKSITREVKEDDEPIYGKTYLPRKFKIALAIPPHNDTDIFSNDIGLIAIIENGQLTGYNVAAGGGLGMTFGMPETYPRLGDLLGYVDKDRVVDVCEKIVTIQRDWGNRENRKRSRLKYTIDDAGLEVFQAELEKRLGYALEKIRPYQFDSSSDAYGWSVNSKGNHDLTLFIEGGRVRDFTPEKEGAEKDYLLKTALDKVAALHEGDFRLTGNQNLMICDITPDKRGAIEAILEEYGVLEHTRAQTGLRLNSIACVALNTCSQAFSEAERYLPSLIDKIDLTIRAYGLEKEGILIRMTGCPNGCGRPYLGEIGLVGRAPGIYNLYLGASYNGERLNKLYREMLNEEGILSSINPILEAYATQRETGEKFGDFVIRNNYVKSTTHGTNFHHAG